MTKCFILKKKTTWTPITAFQSHLMVRLTVIPTVLLGKINPTKYRFIAKFCYSCIGARHALKYWEYQEHSRLLLQIWRGKIKPCFILLSVNNLADHFCFEEMKTNHFNQLFLPFWNKKSRQRTNHGLGWTNFVLGRWSPKWQAVQQKYLTSIKSRRSSLCWAAATIHKLLMAV